ncbi:YDG/SRA domain-containing protein [Novosphingobium sp.]|jgi:putative restriction endonuclease|uniref:YDG/SRA domain-containing protein n=1 Tax=Novosphingobium sp. TaxID=1874826 RepID=UPI002FE069C3
MIESISGPERGAVFKDRRALFDAGWHNQTDAGIAGNRQTGATSVVLSGGYPDDEDRGDMVIYTGHGGRGGRDSTAQAANQTFDARGNAALVTSCLRGTPIRVFRGGKHKEFRPATGYRYDGLYRVDSYWYETGRAGFQMCRFKLVALEGAPPGFAPSEARPTKRVATTIQRLVRDTAKSREVKEMHDYHCQACGIRLECVGGPYAEGAHIRPLGRPHDGPDETTNLLCLCPNHHVLFDNGGFSIADDFSLIGLPGKLRTVPRHQIGGEHLRYHREQWRPR